MYERCRTKFSITRHMSCKFKNITTNRKVIVRKVSTEARRVEYRLEAIRILDLVGSSTMTKEL